MKDIYEFTREDKLDKCGEIVKLLKVHYKNKGTIIADKIGRVGKVGIKGIEVFSSSGIRSSSNFSFFVMFRANLYNNNTEENTIKRVVKKRVVKKMKEELDDLPKNILTLISPLCSWCQCDEGDECFGHAFSFSIPRRFFSEKISTRWKNLADQKRTIKRALKPLNKILKCLERKEYFNFCCAHDNREGEDEISFFLTEKEEVKVIKKLNKINFEPLSSTAISSISDSYHEDVNKLNEEIVNILGMSGLIDFI